MATETVPAAPAAPTPPKEGLLAQLRRGFGGNVRQYGMVIALAALVMLFQVMTDGLFLQPRNVTSLLVQNGYVLILAIGMVMVIILGHIDLSVGSVCAFVGASVAMFMKVTEAPWPLAILVGLIIGALVGAWQGYWVAIVGIPAFIVTLAGMMLFRGLDLMILNAESVPVPDDFQRIANGYIPNFGPATNYHNPTLILAGLAIAVLVWMEVRRRAEVRKHNLPVQPLVAMVVKLVFVSAIIIAVAMLLASYKGIPVVGLILLALVILYSFLTQKTVFGRHIYATGGNRNAAALSGVNTRRVDFLVMLNNSVLAAVAGMVFTAYLNAANPKDGQNFELDAIASVFIGGAAVAGGVGTVVGSMVGGLVMGVLNLGLANLSVDSNWIQIIKGLVLLGAVAFDVVSKKQGRRSFIGMIQRAFQGDAAAAKPVEVKVVASPKAAGTKPTDKDLTNPDDLK